MTNSATGQLEARLDRDLRELLRQAPGMAVADLPESTWARVSGVVHLLDGRVLEAPLSGRPCVYYAVRIDSMVAPKRANTLMRQRDAVPFLLEDHGHRAVIDPTHARISAEIDHASKSAAAFDATPRQRSLLATRRALFQRHMYQGSGLLYYESIIEEREPVAVLGAGIREPDPDAAPSAYRDMATRIQLAGSQRYPIIICDRPDHPGG
ncbi:MAG: hypothetical protein H6Q90_3232 [Deltaproteobacteria bacterium]|nr:hypothetical protein [Deltaproteobacteria bacterium]